MKPDKKIAELYHKQSDLHRNWRAMQISGLREELSWLCEINLSFLPEVHPWKFKFYSVAA